MQYEIYYNDGGHSGPFNTFELAHKRAVDALIGARNITCIEIRPSSSKERGGYKRNNPDSQYVIKKQPKPPSKIEQFSNRELINELTRRLAK